MPHYDSLGLPKDVGATDFLDSARLAGLLVLFGKNTMMAPPVNTLPYVNLSLYTNGISYVRHPNISPFDPLISRDQVVPLFAGMWRQHSSIMVDPNYQPPNKDYISPSVRGHFIRCAGGKAHWYQDLWLVADILWSAYVCPLDEPNQLISMLIVAGPWYLKLWTMLNKQWEKSILDYWCENQGAWRQEPELAKAMIETIKLQIGEST